ncbi:hypothetical protein GCM10009817_06650 [Terrabacter lapilli]|uniref:Uncharacterized protein n=1 Tax=Terrabacter lapilli TaxID=436231 RepID=A0ABN2RHY6_9MICO
MTTLGRDALAALSSAGITPREWIGEWSTDGTWSGDTCGCPDDRCIGHHHDARHACGCLPALLEEAAALRAAKRSKAALREAGAMD